MHTALRGFMTWPKTTWLGIGAYGIEGFAVWTVDKIPWLDGLDWVKTLSDIQPELLGLIAAHLVVISVLPSFSDIGNLRDVSTVSLILGAVVGYFAALEFLDPYDLVSAVAISCIGVPLLIVLRHYHGTKSQGRVVFTVTSSSISSDDGSDKSQPGKAGQDC